jgi:hypothetical protein
MITNTGQGLMPNVNPEFYHDYGKAHARGKEQYVMSRTDLCRFARNPQKWFLGEDKEETDALEWGSLLDCIALTPELFEKRYAVCPETYPVKGMECPVCKSITESESCKKCASKRVPVTIEKPWNWQADYCGTWRINQESAGMACVKPDLSSKAWLAAGRLYKDPLIEEFMKASERQVMVVVEWQDEETGISVPIKCLLDLVPDRKHPKFGTMLADLKSARNGSVGAWPNVVANDGLHIQAALYLDAYNAATGHKYETFHHIISENVPPYVTARRMLSDEFLNMGRVFYKNALMDYCQCLKAGEWPGYDDHPRNRTVDGWTVTEPAPYMIYREDI